MSMETIPLVADFQETWEYKKLMSIYDCGTGILLGELRTSSYQSQFYIPCSCNSIFCPHCREKRNKEHKKKFNAVIEKFSGNEIKFFTVTLKTYLVYAVHLFPFKDVLRNFKKNIKKLFRKLNVVAGVYSIEIILRDCQQLYIHAHVLAVMPYVDQIWISILWERISGSSVVHIKVLKGKSKADYLFKGYSRMYLFKDEDKDIFRQFGTFTDAIKLHLLKEFKNVRLAETYGDFRGIAKINRLVGYKGEEVKEIEIKKVLAENEYEKPEEFEKERYIIVGTEKIKNISILCDVEEYVYVDYSRIAGIKKEYYTDNAVIRYEVKWLTCYFGPNRTSESVEKLKKYMKIDIYKLFKRCIGKKFKIFLAYAKIIISKHPSILINVIERYKENRSKRLKKLIDLYI